MATSMLKQRLIGAAVLIALGVIFIPMLLTGDGNFLSGDSESNVPPKPMYELEAPKVLPLNKRTQSSEPVGEPASQVADASKSGDSSKGEIPAEVVKEAAESQSESAAAKPDKQSENTKNAADKTAIEKHADEKPDATQTEEKPVEEKQKSSEAAAKSTTETEETTSEKKSEPATTKAEKPVTETMAAKKPVVSGFVVQLGSFSVKKNALNLRDSLRKKGHASFVEEYRHNGKVSYRVRVGPEQTRELANDLKKKLKAETKIDGFIVAFPG